MKRAALFLVVSIFVVVALSSVARAQVPIVYYDFESNAVRTTFENLVEQAVNAGSGPFSITTPVTPPLAGVAGAGGFRNNDDSAVNGTSLSTSGSPNWAQTVTTDPGTGATAYYQFVVNTSGFSGMSIEFDSRASATGPCRVGVLYSTDGVNFISAGILQNIGFNAAAPTDLTSWATNVFDLSSITAIDNQASVTIRIYAFAGSAGERSANNTMSGASAAGTFRVDNATVRAKTATASKTLLDYPAIGLSLKSGVAFTPTYSDFEVNGLGITVTLASDLTVTNTLTFTSGNITTGVNILIMGPGAEVERTSGHIIGNMRKSFGGFVITGFEVGTANGYSPVTVQVTAATFPVTLTISATQGAHVGVNGPTSIQRYWTLTMTGVTSADLTFQYLAGDVMGNEANYKVIRASPGPVSFPSSTVDTVAHTASVTGITSFSQWTVGEPVSPTAANGSISGTITDSQGAPVAGTVINLSGTQNRKFITDANGNYRFDNVETNGFYTVKPTRANYGFSPGARSFSQLGESTEATFTAVPTGQNRNPLDTPEYFVRQHYLDFLGREPDEAGFNFWSNQILECGNDADCIERRTVNVSAAYFLSVEFQRTGGLLDRLYKATYGRSPLYAEFIDDRAALARGVVVGRRDWESQLAANEETFVDNWVERAAFHRAFDSLASADYVDTLVSNTGVSFTQTERDSLVSGLSGGSLSRASVLQQIANNDNFARARFNEAFVMMEYFGYLRRDPDASGYAFWLNKLNEFNGNFERAEMVKAFIDSGEYRARFDR